MKINYLVITLALLGLYPSCALFYVAKQGVYQMELLAGAVPIEQALRSPDLNPEPRSKLILISGVREFSEGPLKLVANKNYKDVNLSWKHIIYNVSASQPLEFKPYTWWFPLVGYVPYKGFFDQRDADAELVKLKDLGLDILKRRVGGYSTLGYFSDPVWPTMLEMSDEALVELIIHELAHATVYFPNQTPFNETFANFVGKTGARLFYVHKFGEHSPEVRKLDKYYRDEIIYNDFFTELYAQLDKIYTSAAPDFEKRMAQEATLKHAEKKYQLLPIGEEFKHVDWSRVNNAYLLAFKTYNQDEQVFADLYRLVGQDFGRFLDQVATYGKALDPFASLRRHIDRISSGL